MPARLQRFGHYLFPHAAERDPGFRREIRRLSILSLYVIAGVTLCMPLVAWAFHWIASIFEPISVAQQPWTTLPFLAITAGLVGAARTRFGRDHARKIAILSGFASGAVLIWGCFLADAGFPDRTAASVVNVIVVMLVGVAAIPLWPIQIFLLGCALSSFHYYSAQLAVERGWIEPVSLHSYAGLDSVSLLCAALAAVNYQRLIRAYRAHQRDIEVQSRLLVSENAASLGRFAATLSHELNNPIGVAASAVDSLQKIETRADSPAEADRLKELRGGLLRTALESLRQLRQVVGRMQRLTNLDRAEKFPVNLDDLLRDVTAMLAPEARRRVRLDTPQEGLPPLTVKPQQISAVLAQLLERAAEASGETGNVEVSARRSNGQVEIRVADEGAPLTKKERESLFEPGFAVRGDKVEGANWSLFSARRAVQEHGGDIEVRSRGEVGAEVTLRLPV